jgi:phosphoribosylformylglycinamidine (FGAM) synthase-like enzyme
VHDLSDGGLLIALTEMAIASGIGARLDAAPSSIVPHAYWYGEDQARYIVTVPESALLGVLTKLKTVDVPCVQIGITGGHEVAVAGERAVHVKALLHAHEAWLPNYMNAKAS